MQMNSKLYRPIILVVDDTRTKITEVINALESHGYRVVTTANGKKALYLAHQICPDLILLNLIIPGEDSFEVCRYFKSDTQTRDIPIIFMIPEATINEYKTKCFTAGCIDYITTPICLDEITLRLTTHIELTAARRELNNRNAQLKACRPELSNSKQQLHAEARLPSHAAAQLALKRFVLERIHEATFLVDEAGQIHYINQAVCNRLGYTQEELLKMNLKDIDLNWPVGLQGKEWITYWDKIREEGEVTFETQHITRSGEIFPVEVTAYYFENNSSNNILGLVRDISKRKQTQAELHQYREHLEELVTERTESLNRALKFTEGVINAIPDLLVELDQYGRYLNIWTCFQEDLAAQREGLLGKTVGEVLSPEAATTVMSALAEASTVSTSFGKRILIDLPTGPSWFELSVSQCPGSTNGEPHFLVLSRDISERIRAEEEICRMNSELGQRVRMRTAQLEVLNNELRTSEIQYRSLVENLPDNVIRYNSFGQIMYCNLNFLHLFSLTIEDVLGKTPCEIFPDLVSIKIYQAAMLRVITSGQSEQIESEVPGYNGKRRTYQVRFVAERDVNGTITGALSIGHDITEQVITECQLAESHAKLRSLLARREADLDEERRRIAREMHDELGQLLNALKLGISTLKMQFGQEFPALETKVNDLLTLADQAIRSVRTVSTQLRPPALDMGIIPALQWLADEFQQLSGVTCQLRLPYFLYNINELCAMTLFRSVQEALTNAARHADASHVQINLNRQSDGTYFLKICDDGIGFDPTNIPPGHFGLIGMRERINSLGGTLEIDSDLGTGTCIHIYLPDQGGSEVCEL